MGRISDAIAWAWRDFVTDGVASSGLNEPSKAEIRSIGPVIEEVLGAGLFGGVEVFKETRAALEADLVHAADTKALVWGDATNANNDIYIKVGDSGSGSWTLTTIVHDALEAAGKSWSDLSQAWAEGTEPGGSGTKSAKGWADSASALLAPVSASLPRLPDLFDAAESGNFIEYAARAQTNWFNVSLGFTDWAQFHDTGSDIDADKLIDAVGARLQLHANTSIVRMKLWSRPKTDTSTTQGPGGVGTDVLLDTVELTPIELDIAVGSPATAMAWFPLTDAILTDELLSYAVEIDARDGSGARLPLGVGYLANANSQRRRGFYRNSTTTTGWSMVSSGTGLTTVLGKKTYVNASALQEQADANTAAGQANSDRLDVVEASFDSSIDAVLAKGGTLSFGTTLRGGFAFGLTTGVDIEEGAKYGYVGLTLTNLDPAAATLKLSRYTRPSGNSMTAAHVAGTDTFVASVSVPVSEVAADMSVVFPFGTTITASATAYDYFVIEAFDSSSARVGVAVVLATGDGGTVFSRGSYYNNTASSSMTANAAGVAVIWTLYNDVLTISASSAPEMATRDRVVGVDAQASGLTVTLTGGQLNRNGVLIPFAGSVVLTGSTTGSVAGEARTLKSLASGTTPGFAYVDSAGHLANANVSNVVVTRDSDSAVLVLDTDYVLNAEHGAIALKTAGSDVPVHVAYNYAARRYATIYLDPETYGVAAKYGKERVRDAQEFLPTMPADALARDAQTFDSLPSKAIPLFNARIIGNTVELIPIWAQHDGYHRDLTDQRVRDLARSKAALPRSRAKLFRGTALTIGVDGDSIVAMQNTTPSTTTPNGAARDRATHANGYLATNGVIGSDLYSLLPLYTATDNGWADDGAGQVHTRFGHVWAAMERVAEAYGASIGSDIVVNNHGIGGTDLSNSGTNITATTRLNAFLSNNYDLVILHGGMNGMTNSTNEADAANWVDQNLANGSEVIVCGVPRINFYRYGLTYANWLNINRILRRVAESRGVAFIDFASVYLDGLNDISPKDMCGANEFNHPGLWRHIGVMARLISEVLMP